MTPNPPLPATMHAMVTTGHGGYERLQWLEVPLPQPRASEVLLRVLAAGINNTDINTRVGWYAKGDADDTQGWNGSTPFPLIQGADCCGEVVLSAVDGSDPAVGARVLVRSCMRVQGFGSMDTGWLGTDFAGAFAQYVCVPASEAFAVHCGWTDAELATLPCAYGTAENMLHRADLRAGEHVLVTGASGGVGSATVQLALRRGAHVTAITTADKHAAVQALGAQRVFTRDTDLATALADLPVDVVVDNVGGAGFGTMLKLLRRGGRYATSGAIAGAEVALDLRDLYLKDIRLLGSTAWDVPVFPQLIGYVERGEIRPLLAATFPMRDMARAQQAFLEKKHLGKMVLMP